jgi:hypothetical protein
MADEELIAKGLDVLEGLIGLVLEEALEQALSRPLESREERLQHIIALRQGRGRRGHPRRRGRRRPGAVAGAAVAAGGDRSASGSG